jgi:hypothetical protein
MDCSTGKGGEVKGVRIMQKKKMQKKKKSHHLQEQQKVHYFGKNCGVIL